MKKQKVESKRRKKKGRKGKKRGKEHSIRQYELATINKAALKILVSKLTSIQQKYNLFPILLSIGGWQTTKTASALQGAAASRTYNILKCFILTNGNRIKYLATPKVQLVRRQCHAWTTVSVKVVSSPKAFLNNIQIVLYGYIYSLFV